MPAAALRFDNIAGSHLHARVECRRFLSKRSAAAGIRGIAQCQIMRSAAFSSGIQMDRSLSLRFAAPHSRESRNPLLKSSLPTLLGSGLFCIYEYFFALELNLEVAE